MMELRTFEKKSPKRGFWWFWWGAVILLLSGASVLSWVGSFYVVAHPEIPRCYKVLKKLKRIEPPKRFALTDSPKGEFLTPNKVLERFGKMGPAELDQENAKMLRDYLMSYRETKRPVVYITGKYDVVDTYPLTPRDFFPTGASLISQAIEFPQMVLETLLPVAANTVPTVQSAFPVGYDMHLDRGRDLFALIHVQRISQDRMQFTTVPIPYGGWRIKNRSEDQKNRSVEFKLHSPEEMEAEDPKWILNLEAGLPVIHGDALEKGLEGYAAYRRQSLANASEDQSALAAPELERFEVHVEATTDSHGKPKAPKKQPETPPQPEPTPAPHAPRPAATPVPAGHRPLPTPAPAVPLPPRPVVVKNFPKETPDVPVVIPPPPLPGEVAASSHPAPPVEGAPTAPISPNRRILAPGEASALVGNFENGQSAVLTGDFVVTGVMGQRVAMRSRDSLRDAKADPSQPGSSAALVVVDFPEGTPPPAKGAMVSRDGENGFRIRDVIRGSKGQIMIVASEGKAQ